MAEHPKYIVPTRMYHIIHGSKVFHTQEEVVDGLENGGWERTPINMEDLARKREMLNYHKEQVSILTAEISKVEALAEVKKDEETIYKCEVCGRICASKLGLKSHMSSHKVEPGEPIKE